MKLLLALLAFFTLSAQAQIFRGTLSSSMGGTGRAAIDSLEGAFLNPALVPLLKDYEIDGYYRDGTLDPGQHKQAWGVGAGDNSADVLFPAEVNYVRLRETGVAGAKGPVDSELMHLAIGKTAGNFSFGISGYRLASHVTTDQEYDQWNYSLGTLAMINPDMGIAYVLANLARPGSDVPVGLRQDMQQGVGFFSSIFDIARLRIDITRNEVNNVDKKMIYMIGFENMATQYAIFRMGYRHDDQMAQDYLTLGFGLHGPRLKLDYAFEKCLKGTSEALHSVDLRLPF
jgi:hypothetical protein